MYTGRLAADKNIETLISAFANSSAPDQDAQLIIIGNGPMKSILEQSVATMNISQSVKFVDYIPQDDLVHYYRAADLTAITSDKLETFCMVALEAIACECPLVVTDQVPEITAAFPDVATISPFDTNALSKYIDIALDQKLPPTYKDPVFAYDWNKIVSQYITLYNETLNASHADATH